VIGTQRIATPHSAGADPAVGSVWIKPRPSAWHALARQPLGVGGAGLLCVLVAVAVLAPWIAPSDPNVVAADRLFAPPGTVVAGQWYLLGTDNFGRDVLSRIIWGARISLAVGLLAVAFGSVVGGLLGISSGFFGGRFDLLAQRCVDALQSLPGFILALAIVTMLGPSIVNVTIAIAVGMIPTQARVMRSAALDVRGKVFVEAARAIGCSDTRLLFNHVLPNCVTPFIVLISAELGGAILAEASLSFLGLGVPPPASSWGAMLSGGVQQFAQRAPWMAIFPGLAISLGVVACNLLGDSLRDVLDPKRQTA
jgi:peptide/nickel transport system permease protein